MVTPSEGGQGQPFVVEPRPLIPLQQKRRTFKWVRLETLFLTFVGSPDSKVSSRECRFGQITCRGVERGERVQTNLQTTAKKK